MNEQYQKEILDIIQDVLMLDSEAKIDFGRDFQSQLEMDSMDALDIIMQVKEKYALEIPKEDYIHFASMDKLVGYLASRMEKAMPPPPPSGHEIRA